MIRPIFDRLPGPAWLRVTGMMLTVLAALAVAVVWGFPAVDLALFPPEETTVVVPE